MSRALLVTSRTSSRFGDEARTEAFRSRLGDVEVVDAPQLARGRGMMRVTALLEAIEGSDAVVFAGGPLCQADEVDGGEGADLTVAAAASGYARVRGKSVAMVGIGAGALPRAKDRALARGLVRFSDLLVLRDEESGRRLEGAGAARPFRIGAEPTWVLVEEPRANAGAGDGIAVVLDDNRIDCPGLAHALDVLSGEGFEVCLVPCRPVDDAEPILARALALAMRKRPRMLPYSSDLEALISALRGSRVVLTTSVAGLVAATAAGCRVVAVEGEPGTAALAGRLGQTVGPAQPRALAEAVAEAAAGMPVSPMAVRQQIGYAEESFRLLRILLNNGRSGEVDGLRGLPLGPEPW